MSELVTGRATAAMTERCIGPVRWVNEIMIDGGLSSHRTLQQYCEVCEYDEHGTVRERRLEWRDVPVVPDT